MRKDNEELYTIRKEFNPLEWEENAWNFFQIAHSNYTSRRGHKNEKRFLESGVFCMLTQNRARCTDSAILTAIASCRDRGGARGGRNILRARDYQYARDTASPFFLGERTELPSRYFRNLARSQLKYIAFALYIGKFWRQNCRWKTITWTIW